MRRDHIAFAAVKVQDFDSEIRSLDHAVDQSLKPDLVNLRPDGLDPRSTILLDGQRKESLVPMRIEFHPSTC